MPYTPSTVPDNVPKKYAAQFSEVWNSAYAAAIADKKSPAQAEETAFAQAHGVILKAKQKDDRDVSSDGPGFGPTRTEDGGQASDPQQTLRYSDDQPRQADGKFGSGSAAEATVHAKDLKVGMTVKGNSGQLHTVVAVYPPESSKGAYYIVVKDAHGNEQNLMRQPKSEFTHVRSLEARFSADQERGPDGKFGSGTSSSPHEHEAVKAAGAAGGVKDGDKYRSSEPRGKKDKQPRDKKGRFGSDKYVNTFKKGDRLSDGKRSVTLLDYTTSRATVQHDDGETEQVESIELRYSEDQPRVPEGKFVSTAGESAHTSDEHLAAQSDHVGKARKALAKGDRDTAQAHSDAGILHSKAAFATDEEREAVGQPARDASKVANEKSGIK